MEKNNSHLINYSMKFANPFSNLHLSEQNQRWVLPVSLSFFAAFFLLINYLMILSWTLYTVPIDNDTFFADARHATFTKWVLIAIGVVSIYRLALALYDFFTYYNRPGNKISANYLYWIISSNILSLLVFLAFAFVLAYTVHVLTGWHTNDVFGLITNQSAEAKRIYHFIPNLLQLPGVVAAIIIYLVWSFLLYANHYLGHTSRLMWLLSHRPHHVTTALTNGTGFLADMQFIVGWVVVIIETVIVVMVSKLITTDQETVMLMFFGYAVFYQLIEVTNHAATFYQLMKNNQALNFISKLFATGPYHVLHHSSHADHTMVNLGGNTGFWDFVFGTYCALPEEEPDFGLTHQPTLELSAIAIVFGGLQQLFYELKHNKGFVTRFKIIFGGIYYKPPITKDFLIIADGRQHVVLHKIQQ